MSIRFPTRLLTGALLLIVAACRGDAAIDPVAPAPVAAVTLAAPAGPFFVGDTVPVAAVLRNAAGHPLPGRPVAWAVSPADVATITPDGMLRLVGLGTATVQAIAGGVTGTLDVTASGYAVQRLSLRPRALALRVGESLALGALAWDTQGVQVSGRPIAWSSSDPGVVRVSEGGLATMVGAGTATIRAQGGAAVATIPVTVDAAAPSAFALDVRFVTTPDTALARLMRHAAGRWERVVTGALPAYRVDLDAGMCGKGSPAVHESLANLTVLVRVDSIDGAGRMLGWSSPCLMRRDGTTVTQPVLGVLVLDRDDVSAMLATADTTRLDNLLAHELGHVLGIGLDWHYFGLRTGENTTDVRYVGAGGRAAAWDLGFTAEPGEGVPVESTGGGSTRNVHWSEATFNDELMTGWVSAGRAPLSLLTVRSLADLGYTVQAAGADAFSVVDTHAWPSIAGTAGESLLRAPAPAVSLEGDVTLPRFTVTRTGTLQPWGQ